MSDFYKGLMDELNSEESKAIQEVEEKYWKNRSKVFQEFGDRKRAVQAACPHKRTYKKSDFDYHKREDWTETYCSDCGKMLSRF